MTFKSNVKNSCSFSYFENFKNANLFLIYACQKEVKIKGT